MTDESIGQFMAVCLLGSLALMLVLGGMVGHRRGYTAAGVLLAIMLGPLGILIAAFLPRSADAQARYEDEVEARRRYR